VYERLEQLAFHPATRACAPFLLIGLASMSALANDAPRALAGGGLCALMACLALIGIATAAPDGDEGAGEHLQSLNVALHAALFAASFFLAALAMGWSQAILP
jgi:hypothetical protein